MQPLNIYMMLHGEGSLKFPCEVACVALSNPGGGEVSSIITGLIEDNYQATFWLLL